MKKLSFAALLLATAFNAGAAETVYDIDGTHTFAQFEINHLGFSTFRGRFDETSGSVTLDAAKKTVSADITIKVDSVSTGVEKLDEHLQKPDFFDEDQFPVITFKSTAAKFKGDKLASLSGDLSMHGVTKPVTLKVTSFTCKEHPMKKVQACGADAEVTIKRSDWGMTTYVPAVSDQVKLKIEVEAHAR